VESTPQTGSEFHFTARFKSAPVGEMAASDDNTPQDLNLLSSHL
jgi:hypothetical protein